MRKILNKMTLLIAVTLSAFIFNCSNGEEPVAGSGGLYTQCVSQPSYQSTLAQSSATSVSHQAGASCQSCHGQSGSATKKWQVAGTLYTSAAGTTVDTTNRTITMGGVTLTTDLCGNYYADSNLVQAASYTTTNRPNASFTMGAGSFNTAVAANGDCNTCHDGNTATPGHAVRVY